MSLNKVMLIGNVGKDPIVRHNENGGTSANFSLATTERYKDRNGNLTEHTEWHNIVCWRSTAEMAEKYIKKGTQIFVEGKIRYRDWEDQNSQKRYTTEIMASNITLLGKRSDNGAGSSPYEKPGYNPPATEPETDSESEIDDLPF